MAGRPAPRPKSSRPKSPPRAPHQKGANYNRTVAAAYKWNKGTVLP